MSVGFVIYETTTGDLISQGVASTTDAMDVQPQSGQSVIQIYDLINDLGAYHIVDGELTLHGWKTTTVARVAIVIASLTIT